MKKNEIKEVLRPIVEEILREILLKEVVEKAYQEIKESSSPGRASFQAPTKEIEKKKEEPRHEPRVHPSQKLKEGSLGKFFQGTAPVKESGSRIRVEGVQIPDALNSQALGGLSPDDPGVSLGAFGNLFGKKG